MALFVVLCILYNIAIYLSEDLYAITYFYIAMPNNKPA